MHARRHVSRTAAFATTLSLLIAPLAVKAGLPPDAARDQTPSQVQVIENAETQYPGIITTNAVYIRCGPAESYYPTMKLDKGARVTVVGIKLDWLKIVPPDGSFCYISKAFVDRNGDGTAGKVNKDAVNVRAGSALNGLKVVPLCQLSVGMDVKIVGEQDEYYKITPPEGKAFVYVNKQFVEPDPNAKPEPERNAGNLVQKPVNEGQGTPIRDQKEPIKEQIASNPATRPATQPAHLAGGSATRPAGDAALAEALYDKVEGEFRALGNSLEAQPIAALLKEYESLVAGEGLTNTLHKTAESRVALLKIRLQNAQEMAQAKADQEAARKKLLALKAEHQELTEQLAAKGVAIYTAVGELQTSSLQLGSKTLYRLTDPANSRTVCYLRSDDGKLISFMGKFIGVKGELTTDPQLSLRVINMTEAMAVEPAKVNHGVTATVIPPSMIAVDDANIAAHVDTRQ